MAKKHASRPSNQTILNHFDEHYGCNDGELESWQKLCSDVGVPEGRSVTQCKKNLKRVYFNIIDFVLAQRPGSRVRKFNSYKALQAYMQNAEGSKCFPLRLAKQNPIMNWMLIELS